MALSQGDWVEVSVTDDGRPAVAPATVIAVHGAAVEVDFGDGIKMSAVAGAEAAQRATVPIHTVKKVCDVTAANVAVTAAPEAPIVPTKQPSATNAPRGGTCRAGAVDELLWAVAAPLDNVLSWRRPLLSLLFVCGAVLGPAIGSSDDPAACVAFAAVQESALRAANDLAAVNSTTLIGYVPGIVLADAAATPGEPSTTRKRTKTKKASKKVLQTAADDQVPKKADSKKADTPVVAPQAEPLKEEPTKAAPKPKRETRDKEGQVEEKASKNTPVDVKPSAPLEKADEKADEPIQTQPEAPTATPEAIPAAPERSAATTAATAACGRASSLLRFVAVLLLCAATAVPADKSTATPERLRRFWARHGPTLLLNAAAVVCFTAVGPGGMGEGLMEGLRASALAGTVGDFALSQLGLAAVVGGALTIVS